MPIVFLIIGLLFLVASIRGKDETDKLVALIRSDFTGPNNFMVWMIALGGLSAVGYYAPARKFSNMFLALVFIVLILTKRGTDGKDFLTSFISQIRSTERTTA